MTTLAQANAIAYTGDVHIDALMGKFVNWNFITPVDGRLPGALYFSFGVDAEVIEQSPGPNPQAFGVEQQWAVRQILAYCSGLTGIVFVEATSSEQADIHFANTDLPDANNVALCATVLAYSTLGEELASYTGDAYVYTDNMQWRAQNDVPSAGTAGYQTLLHEIGHALGLQHPFDGTYRLNSADNNTNHTVMSYVKVGSPKTAYQDYDLQALNWMYGGDGLGGARGYNSTHGLSTTTHARTVLPEHQAPQWLSVQTEPVAMSVGTPSTFLFGFDEVVQAGPQAASLRTENGWEVLTPDGQPAVTVAFSGANVQVTTPFLPFTGMSYRVELPSGAVVDLNGNAVTSAASVTFQAKPSSLQDLVPRYVSGSEGADRLKGSGAFETLQGLGGDDVLTGGGGNDDLNGGAGLDAAQYESARDQHWLARNPKAGNEWQVAERFGATGLDTLTQIERVHFSDQSIALDLSGHAGTVARVICALFGAGWVQDKGIVGIGLGLLDGGMEPLALVDLAVKTDLFATLAGSHSNADFVNLVYRNVVGTAPDAASAQYYLNLLEQGQFTQASLGLLAAETALTDQQINLAGLVDSGLAYLPWAG